MTSSIANGGVIFKPYLLSKIVDDDGQVFTGREGAIREKFVGSDALRSLNGIDKAAQPGNLSFFDFKVKVGQRGQPSRAERLNRTLGLPSSPFDIEVAVTVLVENGGQGDIAAPVARKS